MKKSIGDNALINALLANQIAETPTKKVEEVELPEQAETAVVETPKAAKAIDYTEYEVEPSLEEKEEIIEAKTAAPSEVSDERQTKRHKITAKWGVRLYDQLQGLVSMFAYDKLNTPDDLVERRAVLFKKVYEGKINEKEREELKQVNEQMDTFIARRSTFHDSVRMSEDMVEDINELVEDLLEMSGKNINPVWILVILLLIQPVINLVGMFSEKMRMGFGNKF